MKFSTQTPPKLASRGLTLPEVLVAVMLLSGSMVAILQIFTVVQYQDAIAMENREARQVLYNYANVMEATNGTGAFTPPSGITCNLINTLNTSPGMLVNIYQVSYNAKDGNPRTETLRMARSVGL